MDKTKPFDLVICRRVDEPNELSRLCPVLEEMGVRFPRVTHPSHLIARTHRFKLETVDSRTILGLRY